jgi:hypothetical protein
LDIVRREIIMTGVVISVNISEKKGVRKKPVDEIVVKTDYGIEGDAHASGEWHRQVSLCTSKEDAGNGTGCQAG